MSEMERNGMLPPKRRRLDHNEPSTGTPETPGDQQAEPDPGGAGDAPRVSTDLELGERLRKVMLCTVCLELPHPDENYQCTLGHILCEDCATRLLAQAAMKQLTACCPHCRTPISWKEMCKNLAVGQTLWELPKCCPECELQMDYKLLEHHLKSECSKRWVKCQYRCLGCRWEGCRAESAAHEAHCKHLAMSSDQILSELQQMDAQQQMAAHAMHVCYRQLSAQRIFSEDLELRWQPMSTRHNSEWKFHASTIYVFEHTWAVRSKLRVNTETEADNCLSYSLKLLTTPTGPIRVKYFITLPALYVRHKQMRDVQHQLNENVFRVAGQKSEFWQLQMRCPMAIYRILAMPCIRLRIWMLLH
ncbi:hypothetical protein KR093_010495 [Drosophila rubida]|uniref:Cysteine and histidine-rich protein 1 homolog n=1 Tax=Drosophila rubida TaxID=30044 RepID=A0AAD4PLJ1_9MUSC|nr:hypothetical protein KR093_010495 [Drosophila rubida]